MTKRSLLVSDDPKTYINLGVESTEDWSTLTLKAPDGTDLVRVTAEGGFLRVTAIKQHKLPTPPAEEADES